MTTSATSAPAVATASSPVCAAPAVTAAAGSAPATALAVTAAAPAVGSAPAAAPTAPTALASAAPAREVWELTRPVFFVGFMGAGKTSVARKLARTCGVASVDMDTYLERREGARVKELFARSGEEGFRAIETDVLRELAAKEPLLVSCGGGVVKRPENREILRDTGFVVHLRVTADEAKARISDLSTRPLFQNVESARQLAEERLPLYDEVADATVDTAGRGVSSIAGEVRAVLEKEGVLCQRPR